MDVAARAPIRDALGYLRQRDFRPLNGFVRLLLPRQQHQLTPAAGASRAQASRPPPSARPSRTRAALPACAAPPQDSVPKPKKGGEFNAFTPVVGLDDPVTPSQRPVIIILKTREEQMAVMTSWPEAQQTHFRSMKNEAEANAYLASQGYGM